MGIDRLRRLRDQMERLPMQSIGSDAVAANTEVVADLNRKQLMAGLTKKGEKIEPKYRSKPYASQKTYLNSRPGAGTPDLKLTGAFHRSIEARAYASQLELMAGDKKAPRLIIRYPGILGLTPDNIVFLQREYLLPHMRNAIKTLLQP
jgi:hypothetical protein